MSEEPSVVAVHFRDKRSVMHVFADDAETRPAFIHLSREGVRVATFPVDAVAAIVHASAIDQDRTDADRPRATFI